MMHASPPRFGIPSSRPADVTSSTATAAVAGALAVVLPHPNSTGEAAAQQSDGSNTGRQEPGSLETRIGSEVSLSKASRQARRRRSASSRSPH